MLRILFSEEETKIDMVLVLSIIGTIIMFLFCYTLVSYSFFLPKHLHDGVKCVEELQRQNFEYLTSRSIEYDWRMNYSSEGLKKHEDF